MSPKGAKLKGEMEAPSREAVIIRLRTQRIQPSPSAIREKGKGLDINIPMPTFRCRKCGDLTYRCSQECDRHRCLYRLLAEELSCEPEDVQRFSGGLDKWEGVLQRLTPHFDWRAYFVAVGLPNPVPWTTMPLAGNLKPAVLMVHWMLLGAVTTSVSGVTLIAPVAQS